MPVKMKKAIVTEKEPQNRVKVPEGYKITEVGVIPEDWDCKKLGDLTLRVGSGITPTGGEKVYKQEGRPFVRSQNVGWGKLELDDLVFITDEVHYTFPASEINKGDVLLNITGASIGRSAVADYRVVGGNVNQHVCEIRPNKTKLDSYFLNAFLISKYGQQQIDSFQAGGNRQGLNYQQIRSFVIPLPPLPEQRAIARALSDVDKLIESLDKLIAKKKAIKQAAMQQLLTGKVRLPGFSGEWEVKRLGDVASFFSGGTPSTKNPAFYGGDIPWITSSDLNKQNIYEVEGKITKAGLQNSASKMVAQGTLLIALYGATAGKAAITYINAAINQAVLAIIPNKDYTKFLFYYLVFLKDWIIEKYTQGGQPNLSAEIIKSINISLPKLNEQIAIANILSDMDSEIQALERRREKIKKIKQGMMQQLLTGRVRLVKSL